MLSMKSSIKACFVKTNKPKTEKMIIKLSGENGFITTKHILQAVNIKKIMGLKMNKAISGIAILFGRVRRPLKRSFKHLIHKPIS